MTDFVGDHLEHYGVKGMQWGVRRKRGKDGRVAKTMYKKPATRLSDAELQRRIKRLELEKKYNELNAPTKTRGKQFTGDVVDKSGKAVISTIVGTSATFAVNRALKKKFGTNG